MGGRGEHAGERRRHQRVNLPARAWMLHRQERIGKFTVNDLSAGGAVLTGGHSVPRGERVRVLLEIPGCDPMHLDALVVRSVHAFSDVSALAVAFRHRGADTQDVIQDAVLGALLRSQRPDVLLIDDDPCGAPELETEIAFVGRAVVRVRTPLDAMRLLEDPERNFDLVLVGAQLRSIDAEEVMAFLADEYPRLRRVLVQRRPDMRANCGPADGMLQAPWTRRRLTSVLYS